MQKTLHEAFFASFPTEVGYMGVTCNMLHLGFADNSFLFRTEVLVRKEFMKVLVLGH